jgi:hypothetical protein
MLRENGEKGVSGHDLIYRHGITRAAAIVFDLRKEGWDIETVEGNEVWDGEKHVRELATYVLRVPRRTLAPSVPQGLFDDLPVPAAPLRLDCGCERSADGTRWTERCAEHQGATRIAGTTPW